MSWSDISPPERDRLLLLKESKGDLIAEAKRLGMNFSTLDRRLRDWRKIRKLSVSKDLPEYKIADLGKDKFEIKGDGNVRTVVGISSRIKTLQDLIKVCEIDLSEWAITKHNIKKYEGYRKKLDKDLSFDAGRITGSVSDHGELTIEPLFTVQAEMVRKNPVALQPVISPVSIQVNRFSIKNGTPKRPQKKAVILADPHFGFSKDLYSKKLTPFHDRRALSIAIQLIADIQPDTIVVSGDILDLAEWSDKFVRSPEMYWTTQPSVIEAAWLFAQLRGHAPKADIAYIEGNHEKRLRDYLLKHNTQAYGLRPADQLNGPEINSVPFLLSFDSMGIDYVTDYPNGEIWINEVLRVIHGHRVSSNPGSTATKLVMDTSVSQVFGHVHRIETAWKTLWDYGGSRMVFAFSPGCLCRVDGVVPAVENKMNWQQGIGVISYSDDGSTAPTPVAVPIQEGVAIYEDKVYQSVDMQDYLAALKKDTGWEHF
jgi:hypothetical protein